MSDNVSKFTVGVMLVGIATTVCSYICALLVILHGSSRNLPGTVSWTFLYIFYGTKPFFSLWDNIVPISESEVYSNQYMSALNAFCGVMTVMFLLSAVLIDARILSNNWPWNLIHALSYIFVIIPFYLIVCLISPVDSIIYSIYPYWILSIVIICTMLIIYYLKQQKIIKGFAGVLVFLYIACYTMSFVSLIAFNDEVLITYSWHIFYSCSILVLYILWHFVHVYKEVDNNNKSNETIHKNDSDIGLIDNGSDNEDVRQQLL